jgi:hypothetical protein
MHPSKTPLNCSVYALGDGLRRNNNAEFRKTSIKNIALVMERLADKMKMKERERGQGQGR